jgi:hypothetical protein
MITTEITCWGLLVLKYCEGISVAKNKYQISIQFVLFQERNLDTTSTFVILIVPLFW